MQFYTKSILDWDNLFILPRPMNITSISARKFHKKSIINGLMI